MNGLDICRLERWIEEKADGWTESAPIDIISVAERSGCAVHTSDVPAGRLEVRAGNFLMRVPANVDRSVHRFSVAHELAHALLEKANGDSHWILRWIEHEADRGGPEERLEEFCDTVARILLVPKTWLLGLTRNVDRITIHNVIDWAGSLGVTPDVIFRRLIDLNAILRKECRFLLRFGKNEFSGLDVKWRVAVRALPPTYTFGPFPWENEGIERCGVSLGGPSVCDGNKWTAGEIMLGESKWAVILQGTPNAPNWLEGALIRCEPQRMLF